MAKKSSKAIKAKNDASKSAVSSGPAPAHGASSSHAPAFSSPSPGASSSSGSTLSSPILGVAASPASDFSSSSVSASALSSQFPGASNSSGFTFPSPPLGTAGSPSSGFQRPPPGAIGSSSSGARTAVSLALPVPPGGSRAAIRDARMRSVVKCILDLADNDRRENALAELSKKKEGFQDLAPLIWFSFGTITILMKEVLSVYPLLSPPSLTPEQSNRACNALVLLQCVASHPDTRILFTRACIPFYLYMFLNTTSKSRPFEHLRLSTLGVIGALVKVPDTEVIVFLLSSEIMPLCLRAMESGSEFSRTVATFIVQRLLLDNVGLGYVCSFPERLFAVNLALRNVVVSLVEQPSARLLKHVLRCYVRLSEDERGLYALRISLPKRLTDGTFDPCLREDETVRMWLQQLLNNVQGPLVTREGTVITLLMWMLSILMSSSFPIQRRHIRMSTRTTLPPKGDNNGGLCSTIFTKEVNHRL